MWSLDEFKTFLQSLLDALARKESSNSQQSLNDYERELHQIGRHYDTQLWAIPAVFFSLTGVILHALRSEGFWAPSWWNVGVFLVAGVISWLLLLLFYKVHFQQLRSSSIIKKKHPELASFYSISRKKIVLEIQRMKAEGYDIGCFQEWIVKRTVSGWVKVAMVLSIAANFAFAIYFSIMRLRL